MDKNKADAIIDILWKVYGDTHCGLDYRTPFELLIATILSAQCTDVRVNIITKELFAKADDPKAMAELGIAEVKRIIHPCGLSASKAANIIATCNTLNNKYNGKVPNSFNELTQLSGVGRKTANVVLSNAFGVAAIAVDTHVQRVSNRLGLAHSSDVVKTEKMLQDIIDKDKWSAAHHWLIWHGRQICTARNPKCGICPLMMLCEYEDKKIN